MPTLVYRKRGRPNAFVFGAQDTPITIGRNTNCVIVVDSAGVSRQHAEITTPDDGKSWELNDLRSVNGTFVNGEKIEKRVLIDKDVISCGEFLMEFRRGPGSGRVHMSLHNDTFAGRSATSSSSATTASLDFSSEAQSRASDRDKEELTVNLEPSVEVGPLYRRIHELEANNQILEDELLLLRKTIQNMRQSESLSTVEVELPMEATPTLVRQHRIEAPIGDEFARLLDVVPPKLAGAITTMMDLDRRRNAVLEQLLGMLAQVKDGSPASDDTDEGASDDTSED